MKKLLSMILLAVLLVAMVPVMASAQDPVTCQEEVVVQKDDWLSKYADKYLGNGRAWPAIFNLHNQAAEADPAKFPDKIENPDLIEVGWTICIPAAEEATSFLTSYAQGIDCMGAASGDQVSVLYQWSGTEEEKFNAVVKPLVDACGIQVVAQSSRDDAVLDTLAKSTPPDVVFWPKIAPLTLYTSQLKDLGALGADPANYAPYWQNMGSVGGKWLGVPVKADIKTIIWYSPANFELFGYTVPTTWAELETLVEKMVADGNVPWSMGMESGPATGWTGSDFIQDILLVQQGPQYVMDIIDGTVPYNDAGVVQAYQTYGKWAKDGTYTVGGATGTVSTPFLEAIYKVFSDPPEAMLVKQSGFAGGEVAAQYPNLVYGTDYDFFAVPGALGVQGGADFMMAFGDSPAAKALVAYLTSPRGAAEWAKAGFDLSPNRLALGNYADAALIKKSIALAGAAGFTPDIGDTIPAPFGEAEWKAIVDYVNGADLDAALSAAAAAQADALK
jgi:alpha-glucoside transport system substrate-binding protein